MASATWAVLFVRVASPGAVFRFVQRQRMALGPLPNELLLSEALPPKGWRILTIADSTKETLMPLGKLLSVAFPPEVVLLYRNGDEWGHIRWHEGEQTEEGTQTLPPQAPLAGLLSRLPGMRFASPPYVRWALSQGLPGTRIDGLDKVSRVDYRTVSTLDERNLLIENSPRLYRFPI